MTRDQAISAALRYFDSGEFQQLLARRWRCARRVSGRIVRRSWRITCARRSARS